MKRFLHHQLCEGEERRRQQKTAALRLLLPQPPAAAAITNTAFLFLALSSASSTASAIARPPAVVVAALYFSIGDLGPKRRDSCCPRFGLFSSSSPLLFLSSQTNSRNPVASSLTLANMSSPPSSVPPQSSASTSTNEGDGGGAPPPTGGPKDKDDSLSASPSPRVRRCSEAARAYFRDRSVLLTGASGGLGRSLALLLCRDCSPGRVVLSGRDGGGVEAVADECRRVAIESAGDGTCTGTGTGGGTEVQVIPCDLSKMDEVKDLAAGALRGGRIDVLVNNGGISSRSKFVDTSVEVDELVMKVNFLSGAALAKAVVPGMIARGGGGAVVWISGVQGLVGIPNRSSNVASKFAVQGYCEAMRAELAGDGVSVCVVSPGYIRTNLSKSAVLGDGRTYGKMDPTTASGADPFEVAGIILDSVASGRSDVIVAAGLSARAAIWLRFFFPSVLERILVSRYEKSQKEGHQEEE